MTSYYPYTLKIEKYRFRIIQKLYKPLGKKIKEPSIRKQYTHRVFQEKILLKGSTHYFSRLKIL